MKMGNIAGGIEEADQPVVQAFVLAIAWRSVSNSVTTEIPLVRLIRVGNGITFCRTWKQE